MPHNSRPIFGFMQPTVGSCTAISFQRMKGRRKSPKIPGLLRSVVANNVRRLMRDKYAQRDNMPMALAKDAGTSLSTIQRILVGDHGASIDTLEGVARAFRIEPYQLLLQDFTLRMVNRPARPHRQ